ncbi:phage protease [Tsukamurella ocularis]
MTARPALSNVPGVELARTGQWSASTGVSTITRDDLAAAVAAMDCPAVRDPIIKLGHTDPRFDGEPAFGRITNLSVRNACSLIGDLTGMPGWLGPILASAYPSRSIEGEWNHRCAVGHVHPFVITGLALLGITEPAIGSLAPLDDIAAMWADDYQPALPAQMKGSAMGNTIAAAATVEDIRRAYYDREQNYDLWIEEIQLAPLQLIVVDDADGTRARIAVAVDPEQDGDAAITFGEPVPVVVRYDDVAAPAASEGGQQVAASKLRFASRTESRPTHRATTEGETMAQRIAAAEASGDATSGGGLTDDQKAKLREVLGLTDDADEATFTAALEALVKKAKVDAVDPEPTADPAPAAEPTADPAPAAGEEDPAKKKVAAKATDDAPDTVTVDAEQWDEVQKFMASARQRQQADQEKAADDMVDAAFRAGKIGRNSVAAYKGLARKDYEGTKQALDSLAASSAFPVSELGHSVDVADAPEDVRQDDIYKAWEV